MKKIEYVYDPTEWPEKPLTKKRLTDMKLAAEQDNGAAVFDLAFLNHLGNKDFGIEIDLVEAKRLYHRSADLHYPTAFYSLGVMYAEGWEGTEKPDLKMALKYHGHALGMDNMSSLEHVKRLQEELAEQGETVELVDLMLTAEEKAKWGHQLLPYKRTLH